MSLEGQQIDRYRILRLLGSGGMGEVYLAEDARIEQQVAIKVIRAEVSPYPNTQGSAADALTLQTAPSGTVAVRERAVPARMRRHRFLIADRRCTHFFSSSHQLLCVLCQRRSFHP